MKPFYITTPIYYATGDPHIGHAYTDLLTDALARYYRMAGREVKFLTGTDEHGLKVRQKAEAEGLEPQEYVDKISARFRELSDVLAISNDDFIRTTEDRHKKSVQLFWKKVMDAGFIYKKKYTGLYCVGCESFKTEKDLVDGKCSDHQVEPEPFEQENYFFKLSEFGDKLKKLYSDQPDFVVPQDKYNEMHQILLSGLEDVSISRSTDTLKWGIPVPGDDSQVLYVWFDALVNYISAVGYGEDSKMMQKFWPADAHVLGKEISRFHSLLWPAMLMAADVSVPKQIIVHGWITVDGQKMSKSVGNVLDPFDLSDRYGTEPLRYFILREMPFYRDGDFSHARFEVRYNNDLANGLGNLLNRAVAMTERYLDGVVPDVVEYNVKPIWTKYRKSMEGFDFSEALEAVWDIVQNMNKFIDEKEPWKLGKLDNKKQVSEVLYTLLEALRHIAWMLMPVMPETSYKIFAAIGTSVVEQAQMTMTEASKWGSLKKGSKVQKGDVLFPRIESKE